MIPGVIKKNQSKSAFTLIEIICSVAIIAILAALVTVSYRKVISASGGAKCISNMRSLHTSFTSYMSDNGRWPQQPDFDLTSENGQKNYGEWWTTTMKPYVASQSAWQCPSSVQLVGLSGVVPTWMITYTPTIFDALPNRPYQWPNMPWLVEVGSPHPSGGNVLYPDGSVRGFGDIADTWK